MKMPEKVMHLLNDKEAQKILTTVSNEGIPHSIVAGSIMAMDADTICVAEIFMKKTNENISENKNIAVLTVKGKESYLINATAEERLTKGDLFNNVSEQLKKIGLPVKALWRFKPLAVFDQGAGPNAGTKIC